MIFARCFAVRGLNPPPMEERSHHSPIASGRYVRNLSMSVPFNPNAPTIWGM
jgi:hypothetical protein